MNARRFASLIFHSSAALVVASALGAQAAPAVRPLGPVLATSVEPLGAVSQVRALPGGRVIVHDNAGRRVLLFDSTLKSFTVIADSTSGTANAYGARIGGLITYHGDSTLFVDPTNLSMLVIDEHGKIVRTIAAPRPGDVTYLIGGPFGTPAFDARGRLVYRAVIRLPRPPGQPTAPQPDSALIVRFDLTSRKLDTVVKFGIPKVVFNVTQSESPRGPTTRVFPTVNPMPLTDDWALTSDGTIAVVRGHDYRVDFISVDGQTTLGPKIPFEWQRMTDEDKTALLDSTLNSLKETLRARVTQVDSQRARDGQPPVAPPAVEFQLVAINEMPDYRPAFKQGASHADLDGMLWIRTSKMQNGGTVYDVINRKGELADRVLIPPGRVIAGFGPGGIVYMGVVDGNIVRLERARSR